MKNKTLVQINQLFITINKWEDNFSNTPVINTIKNVIENKKENEENELRWKKYLKSIS
jgi:hypothetical protein|tara:strand:+ start:3052 stop:3225 length:174 start_codon:yes stop_codon:yes gene_type:complete